MNFQIGIDTKFWGGCLNFREKKLEVGIDTLMVEIFAGTNFREFREFWVAREN